MMIIELEIINEEASINLGSHQVIFDHMTCENESRDDYKAHVDSKLLTAVKELQEKRSITATSTNSRFTDSM